MWRTELSGSDVCVANSFLEAELLSTERTVNYHESTALIFSRHFNQFEREILHHSSGSLLSEAACSSLEPFPSLTALLKSPIVSTVQYLLWNLQAQVLDLKVTDLSHGTFQVYFTNAEIHQDAESRRPGVW